jgi:hypothetical protein
MIASCRDFILPYIPVGLLRFVTAVLKKENFAIFLHDLPHPLLPPGATLSDGNRFFSPLLRNEKKLLASCLNGISLSCAPGSEPGAL